MREQLIQYVELLFAGAPDCEEIKQEILQNTLDRYDDLVDSGKVPEAAYRLAIAGIGDINEILGTNVPRTVASHPVAVPEEDGDTPGKKLMRAIAVGLYIICALPLIVLGDLGMDNLGLCGTLTIAAVATVLIILGAKKESPDKEAKKEEDSPKSELAKSINGVLWAVGLAIYFLISFSTNDWHISWVIFPILGALDSLITAIVRNQEAQRSDVIFPDKQRVRKGIKKLIWALGIAIYFFFGFATGAWYFILLLVPIVLAVQGLTMAILDLKEAMKYEA